MTRMLMRDLFAVANLLEDFCQACIYLYDFATTTDCFILAFVLQDFNKRIHSFIQVTNELDLQEVLKKWLTN